MPHLPPPVCASGLSPYPACQQHSIIVLQPPVPLLACPLLDQAHLNPGMPGRLRRAVMNSFTRYHLLYLFLPSCV